MSNTTLFPVPPSVARNAWVDEAGYFGMYEASLADPEKFWAEQAKRLHWMKPFTKVKDSSFTDDVHIRWFEDGVLNASQNCIDRHLATRADQTAILWEGDSPSEQRHVSYAELHENVCRLANVLKKHGVKKGDRVTIYMPMIPEAAFAMLACARIGAIHSVVFGGFSPDSPVGHIQGSKTTALITAARRRRAVAPDHLRLSRRRHLLVHGGRRLGHRPQLHRLRPARQRRHHGDVRGRAELPRPLALLAGGGQAQDRHLLHRADRDPRADARGRLVREKDLAQVAQASRHGGRADQSRGLALVLQRGGRGARTDRRHLVADRNRRHLDHAAPGRHAPEAGLGDAAVLRRQARDRGRRGPAPRGGGRGKPLHRRQLARDDADGLWRPQAVRGDLFLDLQ